MIRRNKWISKYKIRKRIFPITWKFLINIRYSINILKFKLNLNENEDNSFEKGEKRKKKGITTEKKKSKRVLKTLIILLSYLVDPASNICSF